MVEFVAEALIFATCVAAVICPSDSLVCKCSINRTSFLTFNCCFFATSNLLVFFVVCLLIWGFCLRFSHNLKLVFHCLPPWTQNWKLDAHSDCELRLFQAVGRSADRAEGLWDASQGQWYPPPWGGSLWVPMAPLSLWYQWDNHYWPRFFQYGVPWPKTLGMADLCHTNYYEIGKCDT